MKVVGLTDRRTAVWQYVKCSNAIAPNTDAVLNSSGVQNGKIDLLLFKQSR